MAILLIAPTLVGISVEGCFGSEETQQSAGKVAISENYSLNRAETGISFGAIISPSENYKGNVTVGNSFSEGVSTSDSYRIVHMMNGDLIVSP
jgi:hypothetical protein